MVADALSRKAKSMESLPFIPAVEKPLAKDVQALANRFIRLDISERSRVLAYIVSWLSLFERIKAHQYDYPHFFVLKDMMSQGGAMEVSVGDDGVFWLHGRVCVPNIDSLREMIHREAHSSQCSIHPGAIKMYHNLLRELILRKAHSSRYYIHPSAMKMYRNLNQHY
uniref:Uncharacterized protein LOC104229742 n=1 Tax=Nicotiana sylvestris TaxID=4096 RepID=A0A1U7X2N7_NICSY|nr:PREDICTED: uncharacterized protein LOC104229742 [Nicotiana sylvestris]